MPRGNPAGLNSTNNFNTGSVIAFIKTQCQLFVTTSIMLNNINSYSTLANITYDNKNAKDLATAAVNSTDVVSSSTNIASNSADAASKENLYLSTKAQKINAISSEFFSSGALTTVDIDKLVERVYEYGLISKSEYSQFSKSAATSESATALEPTSTKTLADFISDFQQRFNSADDDSSDNESKDDESADNKPVTNTEIEMNKALTSAYNILSDVEQAQKTADFQNTLNHSIATLKEVINSDSFVQLPVDDRVGLVNTAKTLEIINKINPPRLDNKLVNRYIDISLK